MSVAERACRFVPTAASFAGGSTVTLAEEPATLVRIAARKGRRAELAEMVRQDMEIELPKSGSSTNAGALSAVWLEPDAWLLQGPAASDVLSAEVLATRFVKLASVVDVSDGRCVFRLAGVGARQVLAKCCRLDFHSRAFAVGATASTLVAHVPCLIRLLDEKPTFELVVGSTFAQWLLEELREAASPNGCSTRPDEKVG